MPDLASDTVRLWLSEAMPPLSRLEDDTERAIERAPAVASALERLGSALDLARGEAPLVLDAVLASDPGKALLPSILAQCGIARLLRLVRWIMDSPGGQTLLEQMLELDEEGTGRSLQASLRQIYRHAALARLFAPERLLLLHRATEAAIRETDHA